MLASKQLIAFLSLFNAFFSPAFARPATIQKRVLRPSQDPFYQPPSGYEDETPGTILRQRQVAVSYFGLIPDPVEAWQLLYRTTATNGTAIAEVTTVFKPSVNVKLDRFVDFNTAYDGAARSGICQPSYTYQLGAVQLDLISSVEYLLLQAFLLQGYIVSAPDYEGPDSAFAAGRLAGMGVLDSMRAVANFKSTLGLTTSTPAVVGYGYSGGGIATGWAASLQQTYAPELNIKGWASGGTPANLTGTAQFLENTLFSGFLPQAIVGLSAPSAFGNVLVPFLEQHATDYGKSVLETSSQICGVENLFTFEFQSLESTTVQDLGDRLFYQTVLAPVLGQETMGITKNITPIAPVYLYHAKNDEVITYANVSTLDNTWCDYGAQVEFVTYANGGHATTEIIGFPGAFNFVNDAFDGNVGGACTRTTKLDDSLDPLALGVQLEPVLVDLLNALAIAGKDDVNIINNLGNLNKTIPVGNSTSS